MNEDEYEIIQINGWTEEQKAVLRRPCMSYLAFLSIPVTVIQMTKVSPKFRGSG